MIGYAYPKSPLPRTDLLARSRQIGKSRMVAEYAEAERLRFEASRPNRQTRRSRRFHDVKRP